jgi:hypothetical protein
MEIKCHHTSTCMQMFACPSGMHHGWNLMLLGCTDHDGIFECPFLGYASECDPQVYAVVVTGCWSAFVALPVQTPWDPGGSATLCYLINGLRASRILRRRECHVPRVIPADIRIYYRRFCGPWAWPKYMEGSSAYIREDQHPEMASK